MTMPATPTSDLGLPDVPDCPDCGGRFVRALVPFRAGGEFLGLHLADSCPRGHVYFTQESSLAIERAARDLGVWGRGAGYPA